MRDYVVNMVIVYQKKKPLTTEDTFVYVTKGGKESTVMKVSCNYNWLDMMSTK